jgi:hypothetical protein
VGEVSGARFYTAGWEGIVTRVAEFLGELGGFSCEVRGAHGRVCREGGGGSVCMAPRVSE